VGAGALEVVGLVGAGEATGALDQVGPGLGESVGIGESVGAGESDGVAAGASTVPMMGLRRSSASERGVTIKRQRTARAMIAFFTVDSGVLAMLARVMKVAVFNIFGRVLPEQFGVEA